MLRGGGQYPIYTHAGPEDLVNAFCCLKLDWELGFRDYVESQRPILMVYLGGFPKIRVHFWGPYKTDDCIWGPYWGPPVYWETTILIWGQSSPLVGCQGRVQSLGFRVQGLRISLGKECSPKVSGSAQDI